MNITDGKLPGMVTNLPLYRVLMKLGASDDEAGQASQVDESHLVTKADLRVALAELRSDVLTTIADLRSDLLKWGVGLLFTALSLQTALVIWAVSRLVRP